MAKPQIEKTNILSLFPAGAALLPPVALDVSHLTQRPGEAVRAGGTGVDLTGKQKLLLLAGSGATGKTLLARYIGEQALLRDDGNPPILLSMDDSRDLCRFFGAGSVAMPPPGANASKWFEQALAVMEKTGRSAIGDFGGGDKILLGLAREMPELHLALEARGITPVLLHCLSPRLADLTLATALEGLGFQPTATACVLNCARADDPERDFAQLRHQPEYQAILGRGGIELWLPVHFSAKVIEDSDLGFVAAGASGMLSGFDPKRNADWLRLMQTALAPVVTWLV